MNISELLDADLERIQERRFKPGTVLRALPFKTHRFRVPVNEELEDRLRESNSRADWNIIRRYAMSARLGALVVLNYAQQPPLLNVADFLSRGREVVQLNISQRELLGVSVSFPNSGSEISTPYTRQIAGNELHADKDTSIIRCSSALEIVVARIERDRKELERVVKEMDRFATTLKKLCPPRRIKKQVTARKRTPNFTGYLTGRAAELAKQVEEMKRDGVRFK
jgi:hypothetical protein